MNLFDFNVFLKYIIFVDQKYKWIIVRDSSSLEYIQFL